MDAQDVQNDLTHVLMSREDVQDTITDLARQIDRDYADKDLLIVAVLKGAVMVVADLTRALHSHVELDFMAVSSYGSGTKSSGVVRILKDLDADLTGRHVLIVEDIIDSGLTLSWLKANLESRGPASVEICTLLRKPEAMKVDIDVKYVGRDIPNEFVVGYGLDYAEKYRNLDFVGTLGERRDTRTEHLHEGTDVGAWLVEAGVLDAPPPTDPDTLPQAIELREALFAVVERLIDQPSVALPRPELDVVNAAAAGVPPVVTLRPDRTLERSGSWRAGLAAVARDGLALVDPGEAALKWCADPVCTHPFLDRSRGHRRRWCEMAGCGDRAKAAAYRARRRALTSSVPGTDISSTF